MLPVTRAMSLVSISWVLKSLGFTDERMEKLPQEYVATWLDFAHPRATEFFVDRQGQALREVPGYFGWVMTCGKQVFQMQNFKAIAVSSHSLFG